jgi:hypothetical protein
VVRLGDTHQDVAELTGDWTSSCSYRERAVVRLAAAAP